jgi:hypothetical protein
LTIGVNQVVPAALAQTLAAALEDSIKEGLSDDAKKLALATRLFKAVEPTVKAGKYQGTLALRGPTAAGRYTGIAGLRVEQGAGLEKALRDLAKELPPEVRQQLTLDHSKLGAFNVHRLTIPANDIPPDGVKILADGSIYAAISNDAIYVALGDTALEALKKAVAGKPGPVPYNLVEASVGKLLGLADDATRAKVQALAKQAFTAKDSDRVRFVVEGGETLKVRLDASTALLTFLGQLGVSSSGQFGSPAKPGK